jgi:integrase
MQTQSIENIQSNVVHLEVVKKSKQNPKLKTDGNEKQTPNNNSIDRWVHPIREKSDVKKCIDYLHERALSATRLDTQRAAYRDWFLFVVGINVGLRVSDLTQLKWDNIFESDMKTFVDGRNKEEQKTGKMKLICPNEYMKKVVKEYLYFSDVELKSGEWLWEIMDTKMK